MKYEVETGNCKVAVKLPFVVGVIGDFSGTPTQKVKALYDRKFVQIDRDNLDEVMKQMTPGLNLRVENTLAGDGSDLDIQLNFQSMADFEPARVVAQVAPLSKLLEIRNQRLRELPEADESQTDDKQVKSIRNEIVDIDGRISKQLTAIMHHEAFQRLEGSWRGLCYLVMNSETGMDLKIRVLNCSKKDLQQDLEKAAEFDQSDFFRKMYEAEFGMPGGTPYAVLIGDFEFQNHPDDIAMLRNMSSIAAAGFCPFIGSTGCEMFGFDSWKELNAPQDISKIFDTPRYTSWNSFRESENSRFVVLTMPRTLARLPYGADTTPIDEFEFEEVMLGPDKQSIIVAHESYCWMSTAFVMGARLSDAFARDGWCTSIRGFEGGGKVENLPAHVVRAENGDVEIRCPTEVLISDRREKEISDLGFLPLCYLKDRDCAVFFGGQTTQKPKKYESKVGDEATANAAICARLPYAMATSRIVHYLKCIARDKFGDIMERDDYEKYLNRWIMDYVTPDGIVGHEFKARSPFAAAAIELGEVSGKIGSYSVAAFLRPWLQFEELTASIRITFDIPRAASTNG